MDARILGNLYAKFKSTLSASVRLFLRLGSTLQLLISTLWRLKEDETQMPSSSSPIGGSPMMVANAHMVNAEHKLPWQPPTLANIR